MLRHAKGRVAKGCFVESITVLCPKLSCRAILRVPENTRGQRVRCGNCGSAFIVPLKKNTKPQEASPATTSPKSENS